MILNHQIKGEVHPTQTICEDILTSNKLNFVKHDLFVYRFYSQLGAFPNFFIEHGEYTSD